MKRLLTAAVATPFVLAAVFLLPHELFFVFVTLLLGWAVFEYTRIVRPRAPHAPVGLLLVLAPLAALALSAALVAARQGTPAHEHMRFLELALLVSATFFSVGLGTLVLFSRGGSPGRSKASGVESQSSARSGRRPARRASGAVAEP